MKPREKLEKNIFRSRLARRMFLAFVFCALAPILLIFLLTITEVTRHFNGFAQNYLKRTTKAHGLAIYERLLLLETDLKNSGSKFGPGGNSVEGDSLRLASDAGSHRLLSVYIFSRDSSRTPVFSHGQKLPPVPAHIVNALDSKRPAIFTLQQPGGPARVFMATALEGAHPEKFLVGEINTAYLWGVGEYNTLPASTGIRVWDQNGRQLIQSLPPNICEYNARRSFADLESPEKTGDCFSAEWSLFLEAHFQAPSWKISLHQKKSTIQEPLNRFKELFPRVVLLAVWLILLFSIATIRKNLIPLQLLKKRTLEVAEGRFKSELVIASQDEFEELANSFDTMADKLSRQFNVLQAIEEINSRSLAHQNPAAIIRSFLSSLKGETEDSALYLVDQKGNAQVYLNDKNVAEILPYPKSVRLGEKELELLSSNPGSLNFGPEDGIPEFLGPLKKEGIVAIALSPFFTAENFSGFLAQGFRDAEIPARHDPSYRQRIAEQLSMALSNAKLVEDLQSLSKGTLRALARAVDTKSPWTAGHSERVAKLAVQIGADMGLAPHEIKKLEKAGFLHDIGKIGVSNLILDKPGKLSDEEYNLIKQHPALGVRILEPLNIFADILPAILHHHEHFDGSGYPHGLKGFEIPLGARILVVADVYDALASDRPYRSGWDNSRIFELLERESGHHFDPEIISVFFKIKTAEKKTSQTSCFPVAKVG